MAVKAHLVFGKVTHKRLFPKPNRFTYGVYYMAFSLAQIKALPMAYNRFAFLSFYDRDHGYCDGSPLEKWAHKILTDYGIKADGDIALICMPRVLGYVFNPVSFWLCHDKHGHLLAVLCAVHNTFGQRHTYLCAHTDHRPITPEDVLIGKKVFHVSPFLPRAGHYQFRFHIVDRKIAIRINFFDDMGKKQLMTSLAGRLEPMNRSNLCKAFFAYPLITWKAMMLIHWQALRLLMKGVQYITKPTQHPEILSTTEELTKK